MAKVFILLHPSSAAFIEGWVAGVEVFGVEVILRDAEGIGKALIMHDLALAEEFDHVVDVGVVRQTQDIVVGRARLLLGGEVLVEIGEDIALDADVFHIKRHARCGDGVRAGGVIYEIRCEGSSVDLLKREIFSELMDDRCHHLEMRELLSAYVGQNSRDLIVRAGISLMQIAHRRAHLSVGAAELRDDHIRELRIGIFYLYGVLKLLVISPHNAFRPFLDYTLASYSQGHGESIHRQLSVEL